MTVQRKKKNIRKRLTVSAITAVLVVFFAFLWTVSAHAEDNTAATMRIKKTEGAVKVAESTGREVSILKNMKLKNGHEVGTEEESYAWISLDDVKLLKMDALSEAIIRKKGKKLEILLESGNLFFEVSEPLGDEEVLNIRTSTMTVGIRGTSGWLNIIDGTTVRIGVLEEKCKYVSLIC